MTSVRSWRSPLTILILLHQRNFSKSQQHRTVLTVYYLTSCYKKKRMDGWIIEQICDYDASRRGSRSGARTEVRRVWNSVCEAEGSVAGAFWVFKSFQPKTKITALRLERHLGSAFPIQQQRKGAALLCIHSCLVDEQQSDRIPGRPTVRGLSACSSTAKRGNEQRICFILNIKYISAKSLQVDWFYSTAIT